ncbi:hypothetical protein GCM10010123_27290 [Pilimelia anulata]|uniref:Metallophosphoesterase n=1 Tax=Pilimelia anulata TaxID=53371 RepID=A0A8J3B5W2_9ACTN|nr:metallophosphoesterase [Pilimelia anulata]GGJ95945.1 hypothetical protein GCM10010123_27290 [Pilimelia anulata]
MTGDRSAAPADDTPTTPKRPTALHPRELGFTPREPVPWLAPLLLLSTGLRTLLATLFGAYLDKRELQSGLPADLYVEPAGTSIRLPAATADPAATDHAVPTDPAALGPPNPTRPDPGGGSPIGSGTCDGGPAGGGPQDEVWLDYIADIGDGFDATYSMAHLLARPSLAVDGHELPRARVLVLGGDQVYPTASADEYEDRFRGPYRAALPTAPGVGPQPSMYAVPGNHDWYDGLTAFLRVFARQPAGNIGGWRTRQSRSYFAVALPHDWWLFGIDEQFGAYLDDPQLRYFTDAAARLGPSARVILAVPAPGWVKTVDQPKAYETVDYFIRTVLEPTGACVRVVLAGDLHHYARYSAPGRELITCGGGGAYLAATHQLPAAVDVPPLDATAAKHSAPRRFTLAARYPSAVRSAGYAVGVFARLPWRNPGFLTMLGIAHTLLMLSIAELVGHRPDGSELRLFSIPLGIMLTLFVWGAVLFAAPPGDDGVRRVVHTVLGVGHGVAHTLVGLGGALVWVDLPFVDWVWPLPALVAGALYGPVSGLLGGLTVAGYLLVAGRFRVNLNELFAGQGIEDAKSFLRLHLGRDGTLTIYPIAVDRVCHRWRAAPAGPPDASWIEPTQPLDVRLAEPPIVIRP